ncbi:hypothetical protein [Petroclostridium sp. X23]|uniref:hypothetical protein n=1 Tax=Petroclostridium sp. X23 TaxID=3045146 RepID=UPI0024AE5780|nr:hypothetical protein [Petroclostridium sp. X23]WHH58453.1 hypothetical protein QKW49_22070 [Petroclostridium sp. X23]
MEKFYIVTEESELHQEYFEHQKNVKVINDHVIDFMKDQGIETTKYYPANDTLYIIPTQKDAAKFAKVLAKQVNDGLRSFKKNSAICKEWVKSLKGKGLKVLSKPHIFMYFRGYERFSWRLFDVDNTLYCSYSCNSDSIDTPKGFTVIKASEFYKVIEDYNEKIKNEQTA